MSIAQNIVTERLYDFYQPILDRQLRAGMHNHIDKVDIRKIEIVGITDFKDDALDEFTAYIYGTMVDLMVRDTQSIIKAESAIIFEDLYHFVRYENTWLLSRITSDMDIWSMMDLKTSKEL
jgi:hypothetical protein